MRARQYGREGKPAYKRLGTDFDVWPRFLLRQQRVYDEDGKFLYFLSVNDKYESKKK